jgi:sulfopyruvate decarboxylase alpha subunit
MQQAGHSLPLPTRACVRRLREVSSKAPASAKITFAETDMRVTMTSESAWPGEIYRVLKQARIRQASYVPDAGHGQLIDLLHADPEIETTVLTTEEEGVALAAGAWLGGQRAVLLLQSSGVGNCINMLSLASACRFPLLMLVTMRGEWSEFNPWQIAMGRATPGALELMGVTTVRVDSPQEVPEAVSAAAAMVFDGDQAMAVLLSQRLIGRKQWETR